MNRLSHTVAFRYKALVPLLCGAVFCWVLIMDYQQSRDSAQQNRHSREYIAENLLFESLNTIVDEHTGSPADIDQNWRKLQRNFYLYKNGQRYFPYNKEPYDKEPFNKEPAAAPPIDFNHPELTQRQAKVNQVKQALLNQDEQALKTAMVAYLQHRQNVHLSVANEIDTALSLFDNATIDPWSQPVVERLLLSGWQTPQGRILAVSDYLLFHNEALSAEHFNTALKRLFTIAEYKNCDLSVYREHFNPMLTQHKSTEDAEADTLASEPPPEGEWLYDQRWLVVQTKTDQTLRIIPISLVTIRQELEQTLAQQGIIDPGDTLHIPAQNVWQSLDDISLVLHSQALEAKARRLHIYTLFKVLLLSAALALAWRLMWVHQRHLAKQGEAIKVKEDFLNLVAHELKTPLASIRVMAETLDKRLAKQLSPKDYSTRILSESDRMSRVIDNMLLYRRFKEGENELRTEPLALRALLQEVADDYRLSNEDEITVNIDVDEAIIVNMDSFLFQLVLRNLFSNAIKYRREAPAHLHMTMGQTPGELLLRDNGIGIGEALHERVFEDFYRDEANGSVQGAGLGLSLSRRIMQSHGGDLAIVSSQCEPTHPQAGTLWRLTVVLDHSI